jgi:hypothetical protein
LRSVKRAQPARSQKKQAAEALATASRGAGASMTGMLVNFDELAKRHREKSVLGGGERVDTQRILEARDQDGKAERVEAAIGEDQILFKWRENLAVLARNLFHLIDYG